ncbi:putative membrane protein [hydrothermal vent metagenome]|uniref:Putative membrane protein n=1 Tax=hydrothermal vent metagenome TaxID=652676 RepID=A0A3B1ALM1_9ZZZZ
MPILIVTVLLQVALVLHIVKTGRNTTWIWIVVMLPLAGSIAYVVVEVLPGIVAGKTGRKVHKNIKNIINPDKNINEASRDYSISDTVENSVKLAEQCLTKNMFDEAKQLFEKALSGMHQDAPDIMFGLARAEFGLTNYNRTKEILDDLISTNPDYKNSNAHLLYARTAENLSDIQLALQEYQVLDGYYSGLEASYRYAVLLKSNGQRDKANAVFEKILNKSKISGKHYNTIQKEWISNTKKEYNS